MTLNEFEEFAHTVLGLAGNVPDAGRVRLLDRLLREVVVRMPSEVAAYREQVQQQQDITDAVKLAAASGRLNTHPFGAGGEPS